MLLEGVLFLLRTSFFICSYGWWSPANFITKNSSCCPRGPTVIFWSWPEVTSYETQYETLSKTEKTIHPVRCKKTTDLMSWRCFKLLVVCRFLSHSFLAGLICADSSLSVYLWVCYMLMEYKVFTNMVRVTFVNLLCAFLGELWRLMSKWFLHVILQYCKWKQIASKHFLKFLALQVNLFLN